MTRCWNCKWKLPRFMFNKLPEGWYSRSGYNYSCRVCSFKSPVRYTREKKEGSPFASLEPYTPTLQEKIKRLFTL